MLPQLSHEEGWGCEGPISCRYAGNAHCRGRGMQQHVHILRNQPRADKCYDFTVTPRRNRSITNMVRNISFIALLHPNNPCSYSTTVTVENQEESRRGARENAETPVMPPRQRAEKRGF